MNENDPIITLLTREGLLNEAEREALLQRQAETREPLPMLLSRETHLDQEQVAKVVAGAYQIEFVNVAPEMIDPMVAHLVSQELASRHMVIPIEKDGQQIKLAMSAPLDLRARDEVELKTGYKVVPVAATPQAVQQAIHYHFDVASVTRQAIASMRLKGDGDSSKRPAGARDRWLEAGDDPITRLVASIVKGGIEARASDIHIEPRGDHLKVRYRVDGMLRPAVEVPVSAQSEVISHIKILGDMDISERRVPQDGHVTVWHEEQEYDLRVSSLPAVGGEKIVLRILDKSTARWSLDTVVTHPEDNRKFRRLLANPYGMLLLTGPTGSGKTTTLYSALQLVNTPQRNIVTVEDPVEYRLAGVTQVQVKPVAGLTFASALRSILRQDPDIILIGEIRDLETAEIAVSAALTGHLVLSTLHTNDAAGAISRLINIGIPPFLVASSLLGTAAQRLVRTLCPRCRRSYEPGPQERALIWDPTTAGTGGPLYGSTGCDYCYQTGYQGRKSIYEILNVSPAIRRLIVEGAGDVTLKQQAVREGMRTLRQSALEEVRDGATRLEEVARVVDMSSS